MRYVIVVVQKAEGSWGQCNVCIMPVIDEVGNLFKASNVTKIGERALERAL